MQRLELLIQFISASPEVERPAVVELALKQMKTRPREMEVRHATHRADAPRGRSAATSGETTAGGMLAGWG